MLSSSQPLWRPDSSSLPSGEPGAVQWLERADPPRSERATPTLPVVGAITWHLRVGGSWRALPDGFPAWRTVYGWFRRWLSLGLFDRLLCDIARLRRRAEPSKVPRAQHVE
jgi:putative transposase